MTPMNWLLVGAAGVGAWWLWKKSSENGADGNGVPVEDAQCAAQWDALPKDAADIPPGMDIATLRAMYMRHCSGAGDRKRCFVDLIGSEPPPECMPVLAPMMGEFMALAMTATASPAAQAEMAAQRAADDAACRADPACQVVGDPGVAPWPPSAPAPLPGTAPMPMRPGEMERVVLDHPALILPQVIASAPTPEAGPRGRPPRHLLTHAAVAENTTATSGLGYTGGMFSRHLFAGMR